MSGKALMLPVHRVQFADEADLHEHGYPRYFWAVREGECQHPMCTGHWHVLGVERWRYDADELVFESTAEQVAL